MNSKAMSINDAAEAINLAVAEGFLQKLLVDLSKGSRMPGAWISEGIVNLVLPILQKLTETQCEQNAKLKKALRVYAHPGFWDCTHEMDGCMSGCYKDDMGKMAQQVLDGGGIGHWEAYARD